MKRKEGKMPTSRAKTGSSRQELDNFRALQEEMLQLSREYSQARLTAWTEEARGMEDSWAAFSRGWQDNLDQMATMAAEKFAAIASAGEASGSLLSQSWKTSLTEISGEVDDLGEHFLQMMEKVAFSWGGSLGGSGSSGSELPSFLGAVLDFGGWFHQGGIVEAHQGMVISPGTMMGDEQLVLAQAGEGILPRESMARLGADNFEALRTGQFDTASAGSAPPYAITIQVHSLDAAGVAGLDWDRVVQRHILPSLQRDAGRTW
jgi:hypothetical protein